MTDEKCPVCGAMNMYLHLEETGGRYICAVCGSEILVPEFWGKREADMNAEMERGQTALPKLQYNYKRI